MVTEQGQAEGLRGSGTAPLGKLKLTLRKTRRCRKTDLAFVRFGKTAAKGLGPWCAARYRPNLF